MFDGQDFVPWRFRKTSRLFSVLEYLWGKGDSLEMSLKDPRLPDIDKDLWTYPDKLQKIMQRNADLRREIEQDRKYYIEKRRRMFGDFMSKLTSAGSRGDTTGTCLYETSNSKRFGGGITKSQIGINVRCYVGAFRR